MARSFSFDHFLVGKRDVRPDRRAAARGNFTRSHAQVPVPADKVVEISGAVRRPAPSAKRLAAPRQEARDGAAPRKTSDQASAPEGRDVSSREAPGASGQAKRALHEVSTKGDRHPHRHPKHEKKHHHKKKHAGEAGKRHTDGARLHVGTAAGGPVPIGALPPVEHGDGHRELWREHEQAERPRESMLEEALFHATQFQRSLGHAAGSLLQLLRLPVQRRRDDKAAREAMKHQGASDDEGPHLG